MRRSVQFAMAIMILAVVALFPSQAHAQCAVSYADYYSDGYTVGGWDSLSDYYNDPNCNGGASNFYHFYTAQVSVTSPQGRVSSLLSQSSMPNGGGGASAYADLGTLENDIGDYTVDTSEQIDCTAWGAGLYVAAAHIPVSIGFFEFTYAHFGTWTANVH